MKNLVKVIGISLAFLVVAVAAMAVNEDNSCGAHVFRAGLNCSLML